MSVAAQQILSSFDLLPAAAKQEVAFEILRRTVDLHLPPLTDDDLVANAEAIFLDLDRREAEESGKNEGELKHAQSEPQ